jgi:hypothetical protein
MNNPDHISESSETFFGVKILKFFVADPGEKKIRIRDGKNSDPGETSSIRNTEKFRLLEGDKLIIILAITCNHVGPFALPVKKDFSRVCFPFFKNTLLPAFRR